MGLSSSYARSIAASLGQIRNMAALSPAPWEPQTRQFLVYVRLCELLSLSLPVKTEIGRQNLFGRQNLWWRGLENCLPSPSVW